MSRAWLWLALGGLLLAGCTPPPLVKGVPETPPAGSKPGPAATAQTGTPDRLQPPEASGPLQIHADRMRYRDQGQVTVFEGRVRVNQEQTWLTTPYLEVRSQDGVATARQGVQVVDHARGLTVTAETLDYQKTLDNFVVRQNVKLDSRDDQGVPFHCTSDLLEWKAEKQQALASGRVVVTYRDLTATADAMTFDRASQEAVLTGGAGSLPRITQGKSVVTGEKIMLYVKERLYKIMGKAQAVFMPSPSPTATARGKSSQGAASKPAKTPAAAKEKR